MDPLVALLDREADFLLGQDDARAFLIQIGAFLRTLQTDPQLTAYLEDVLQDLADVVDVMEQVDTALSSELIELRRELAELRPEADDSNTVPPTVSGVQGRTELAKYRLTLAFFDEFASSDPTPFNADGEGGRAQTLLWILQAKESEYLRTRGPTVSESDVAGQARAAGHDASPEAQSQSGDDAIGTASDPVDRWRRRLGNVQQRYRHALRSMKLRVRISAGLALLKLEAADDAVNPQPRLLDLDAGDSAAASDLARWISSEDNSLFNAVWRERPDGDDQQVIDRRVRELRESVARVREDLRRRIGATRSRVALVNRFKLRCEWHDRDRMRAVAEDSRLPGGPEDRLTAELARYLFDAGLSPLTKPLTAGPQPDLLDPTASFYVDAKQYSASSTRAAIVDSVTQVIDTVGRLRGGPFAVDEAFCVIFRRDGPYYDLPPVLRTQPYRLHLVLIDIAAAAEGGERQKDKPVQILVDEFFATGPMRTNTFRPRPTDST